MRKTLATLAIAAVGLVSASPAIAGPPPASHLHSGEYCTKRYQSFYHRHGYTCKRASDGSLRLYSY